MKVIDTDLSKLPVLLFLNHIAPLELPLLRGGKSPLWCQLQADIFGTEFVNLAVEEGPAYGAALIAIAADQDAEG